MRLKHDSPYRIGEIDLRLSSCFDPAYLWELDMRPQKGRPRVFGLAWRVTETNRGGAHHLYNETQ